MENEKNSNEPQSAPYLGSAATKRYFHELSQEEINQLISDKKTIEYIMETFKQPDWCNYPNALEGRLGCWSLMDLQEDGLRNHISESFCQTCPEYKGAKEAQLIPTPSDCK